MPRAKPGRSTPKPSAKAAAKPSAKSSSKPSPKQDLQDLVRAYRQKLAVGQKYYQQADAFLDEIRTRLACNKRLPMGEGLYAVLVDRFEDVDKVFQPVAMKRFELQIQDSTGKAVRMRDGKRK